MKLTAPDDVDNPGLRNETKWRWAFHKAAKGTARVSGHAGSFAIAVLVILVWGISGPIFDFSDTWQLAINTGTTIVTFLMVFLIQHTQNRDSEAAQLKLDELIRAVKGAKNSLLDLEDLDDEDLDRMRESYEKLAATARTELGRRKRPGRRRKASRTKKEATL
jgi:low affinity Fe/Cu permease